MTEVRSPSEIQQLLQEAARSRGTFRFLYEAGGKRHAEWRSRRVTAYSPPYFIASSERRRGIRYRIDRVRAVEVGVSTRATATSTASPVQMAPRGSGTGHGWWWVAAVVVFAAVLWWPDGDTATTPSPAARFTTSSLATGLTTAPPRAVAGTATPTSAPTKADVSASASQAVSLTAPPCAAGDCDCADFATREQLTLVFTSSAGDPHRLDGDNDGVPCEDGVGSQAQSGGTAPGQFIPYAGNGGGPTLCRDGTYSRSSGRGTCSQHGGIAR